MMVAEVTLKIACCYEVAGQLRDIVSSDEFVDGVKKVIAHMADEVHEDANYGDMCIEVPEADDNEKLKILYVDGEDAAREKLS